MKRTYLISSGIIFVLFLIPLLAFAQPEGSPVVRQYGKGAPFQISDLPAGQLRSALESLPPAAKSRAMERLHSFSFPHQDIEHLRVDPEGGIYYSDPTGVGGGAYTETAPALTFDPGKAFLLHSRPGSTKVVFLNFQGGVVSGTAWGSGCRIRCCAL